MKRTLLSLLAAASLTAQAQTAFTVATNDTTYSFPISSRITLTDNALWVPDTVRLAPDTVEVAPRYRSAYNGMQLAFQSSFSTVQQKNTTGVSAVSPSYLYADSIWAVTFTVDEPKRVIFAAYATDTLKGVRKRIACNADDFGSRCGRTEYNSEGYGYKMFSFGTAGTWTFLFNEKLMQFALVNTIDGSPNLAIMKDTIYKKVDYSKTVDIDNVSDTWYADGVLDGVSQKLALKLKADPMTNRAMTVDGIAYSINTGRTRIKFPIEYKDDDLYGYFPDEYDRVTKDTLPDFRISYQNVIASSPDYCLALTAGDTIDVAAPGKVSAQTNWANPTLTVVDGNRMTFDNGLVMCKYQTVDGAVRIAGYMKIAAGTTLYRDSYYPAAARTDTLYLTKTDSVSVYLTSATPQTIIEAGQTVASKIDSQTGTYDLTDAELNYYAALYPLGLVADTLSADSLTRVQFTAAMENLRRAWLAYTCVSRRLMSPATQGKYLCLGQGSVATGMLFNRKFEMKPSAYANGYTMGSGSGYVAWAKLGVAKNDSTVFVPNRNGKTFETATMMGAPTFGGIDTIDVYVIYNPGKDTYTPVYVARKGSIVSEQWKGTTKNSYPTLGEAISHLGYSSGNMADRFWFAADYDEDGTRVEVVKGATTLDALYEKYSDFTVLQTIGGTSAKDILTEGVAIDVSKTPFTFTKDGAECDFSGAALLKAKNADGETCVVAIVLQQKKLYAYAYQITE